MTMRLRQPLQVLTCGIAIAQDNWHLQSRRHHDHRWRVAYWPDNRGKCVKRWKRMYTCNYSPKRIAAGPPGRWFRRRKINTFTHELAHAYKDVNLNVPTYITLDSLLSLISRFALRIWAPSITWWRVSRADGVDDNNKSHAATGRQNVWRTWSVWMKKEIRRSPCYR